MNKRALKLKFSDLKIYLNNIKSTITKGAFVISIKSTQARLFKLKISQNRLLVSYVKEQKLHEELERERGEFG